MGFATKYVDAITGATPLGKMKEGIMNSQSVSDIMMQLPSQIDNFLGYMGGSMGEVSAIALLLGFAYMLLRKIITWHIPVTIFATVFVFQGVLNIVA